MDGTAVWLHWYVGESGSERTRQALCSCDTDCYVVEPLILIMVLLGEEPFSSHGDSKMVDHLDNTAMSGVVKVEVASTLEGPAVILKIQIWAGVAGMLAGECSC